MRPPYPSLIVLLLLAGVGVLPRPQQDSAPPLALPLLDGSSGPPSSNRLAVPEDLDRPSPALPPPSIHGGTGSRTLKSSNAAEQGRFLVASLDGTIYSLDPVSRIIQWKLATGLPLWHSEQVLSNIDGNEYFIFPGEDWNLYEHRKDIGVRKLNLTVEELVHNTPEIKGSVVTIGSKTTSLYHVDADSGEVLYIDHLPGSWSAVGIRRIEEKPVSSKLDSDKSAITANNIITIVRTDYLLNSSNLGKPLWSMSTSIITASMSPSLGSKLELPPSQHVILPVIFVREDGNPAVAMLPPADVQNSMTLKQAPLDMPLLPEMSGIVASSRQNAIATSLSFESQAVNRELPRMQDDDPIYLNTLQNLSKSENIYPVGNSFSVRANVGDIFPKFTSPNPLKLPYDNQTLFSTSQNSSKGANSAKQNFTQMLSRVLFGVTTFLILLVLCYLKFRKTIKSDKQSSDVRGRQSVVPKKRKVRKAGNYKNGAIVSNHGKIVSSEKGNAQTNSDTYIQNNERYPFTRADDTNDGRWVGRLFVSNSEIGRGSNGTVVLEGVFDSRPVAVKRLLRAHHDVAFKEIQNLIASDRHPNIVRWYGVEQDLDFVYISLERCNCSLSDLIQLCSDSSAHPTFTESPTSSSIRDHKLKCIKGVDEDLELWRTNGFPSSQLLKLMRDVVSGLAHLHELGIIHRDLKPQNVLISNDRFLNAKLSDMGISKRLLEDMSSLSHHATGYGSSGWQAPEQLLHGRQTRAVDLFSLGCILFFCITKGKHPFGSYFERDSNIVNNRVDLFLVDHIPEAVHLLSQLLDANPEMRPTAVEVFCHPFFWRSETRLSFLRDTSDRVELEDRANESELLKALENISSVAFGGRWGEKMDAAFIADMGRYRKYSYDCTRDLLRVIRNKLNHYRELPKELQENLGPVPDGFDRYFSSRFPNLLIEVYKVVSRHCRDDDSFSKYFKTSLV